MMDKWGMQKLHVVNSLHLLYVLNLLNLNFSLHFKF